MHEGYFAQGGPYMWLLLIFLLTILLISGKKTFDLYFRKPDNNPAIERGISAILFLGVLSLIFGVLAQLTGIYIALGEIIRASDISPQITMMGLRSSFTTTLFGLWILIIASFLWFALHWKYRALSGK